MSDKFDTVFDALRATMLPVTKGLDIKHDEPGNLYIDTSHIMKNKKCLWFGGVQTKRNYVSYHLMPVYVNAGLLADISPALKKRMQGKSCFNFTEVDAALFKELKALTEVGLADYKKQGFV